MWALSLSWSIKYSPQKGQSGIDLPPFFRIARITVCQTELAKLPFFQFAVHFPLVSLPVVNPGAAAPLQVLEVQIAIITDEVVLRMVPPEDMGGFNLSHFLNLSVLCSSLLLLEEMPYNYSNRQTQEQLPPVFPGQLSNQDPEPQEDEHIEQWGSQRPSPSLYQS
jgi:hypothetical protein